MIILIILAILILDSLTWMKRKKFNNDCLSVSQGKAIRGLITLVIIFHHLSYEVDLSVHGYPLFQYVGYLCTSLFFFYSGYGLIKSLNQKEDYLKTFIKKRVPSVLLPFIIGNVIYIFIGYFIYKMPLTKADVFASILGIQLINLNEWYVLTILILYVMFYVCFSSFDKKKALILNIVLIILYIFICKYNGYQEYFYNSVLAFPLGQLFSIYETKLLKFLKKYYFIILSITSICFSILFAFIYDIYFHVPGQYYYYKIYLYLLTSVLWCILVILCLMKFKIKGKILNFLGEISYELYLMHNAFLVIFHYYNHISNNVIYMFVVVCCSVISAYLLHKLSRIILQYFQTEENGIKKLFWRRG